ncbi:glyoxalase [Xylanibacillus composti]|uniref:Glyoxalase n=1 Tax=Xylanibacillus composti TaxID=1572762 RepID=A0A8J4M310_9BACL|nr:VOC family protein [Xylanibacillus composti]GIQ69620.1 glyoxalase [Xylanibacillus composti]
MIVRIHHAQITIPKGEEEAARTFYCGVLQLREIPKPESLLARGGFWIEIGDQQVHIGTEDGVDRFITKAHIAYEVEDITTVRQRLEEQNITIVDAVPIPGYDRFEFRDPFGNRVECIQPVPL